MKYNIYCDESCHLEHDGINSMVIGAIWCPEEKVAEANYRIKEIKLDNGISATNELKWVKVSNSKLKAYMDLIDYFFDDDDLHFRCVLVPDKNNLDHKRFKQTHDDWYYKIYFDMLKVILNPSDTYNVYADIKDSNSYYKLKRLQDICSNSMFDFSSSRIIKRMQPIRSEEVQIMQLVDLLIGAVCNENRVFPESHVKSEAKQAVIARIKERSRYSLKKSTLYREDKFNILRWEAQIND